MTDGEAFLLVFLLIYLSDCLVWLPPSGYAVISYCRRNSFVVRRARVTFEALKKGFAVLNPLPPFGTVFVGEAWPISLSADGMAPFSRENPNPGSLLGSLPGTGFVAWEAVEKVRAEEGYLVVNGKRFARSATRSGAAALARGIETIRRESDPARREAAIDRWMRRRFDPRVAARRAAFFRRATSGLRFSCATLFLLVFLVLPFAYWRYQDDTRFYLVLLAAWLLMWQIGFEFFHLHRRFYPRQKADRWQHLLFALVFPHYAIRSLDVLSKGFLPDSHPLAIAAALATDEERGKLADAIRRDADHPIPSTGEGGAACETAESFRRRHFRPALLDLIEKCDAGGNSDFSESSEKPVAVCPRCRTPYESAGLPCEDCGGILTLKV